MKPSTFIAKIIASSLRVEPRATYSFRGAIQLGFYKLIHIPQKNGFTCFVLLLFRKPCFTVWLWWVLRHTYMKIHVDYLTCRFMVHWVC